ncbi:GNAT family N-acetyltransferase [Phenylobacterium sp.]|uniref:GNAT family N-acetyltransferase n=1 Tax=Phenylobacterium sp. TaxID=1871053 RepID=UPI0035AF6B38
MSAKTLELAAADAGDLMERLAPQIAGLIRATGPVSYDYQFGGPDLLEAVVAVSWRTSETLFCAACTTAAMDGDELLGIELGFAGPNFYVFKNNLAALAPGMIARGEIAYEAFAGLAERAEKASYLNAHVPDDVYYLHALSTPPQHRGKGVGRDLLKAAIGRAKAAGYRELQLDVLADNPAVAFYQAMGLRIRAELRSPELTRDHRFPAEYRMAVTL